MSVNSKHLATFLLGAAAALAAKKYMDMTPEEKEKMAADLKAKANNMKDEAEAMMEKANTYFEELKSKGSEAIKEHFPEAENFMKDFFEGKKGRYASGGLGIGYFITRHWG
ncbi:MAG: YtxH domain-containing protein [Bacteroidetes bacterium]|nr:YtxH domain-containing protein [Bacteroidota bacterium]